MNPLVSIILPCYNGEKYIAQAIDSVLKQSNTNWELIISDDSSDDNTIDIIKEFSDIRIKFYINSTTNRGIFSNMNFAMQYARGKYIQFFCQDDIMPQDFIDNQLMAMNSGGDCLGMVFSNVKIIEENSHEEKDLDMRKYSYREYIPDILISSMDIIYFAFFGCLPGNLSPVMIKRCVVDELGCFKSSLRYSGDFEYWVRIFSKYNIGYNRKNHIILRSHSEQASKKLTRIDYTVINEVSDIYKKLFEGIGNIGNLKSDLITFVNAEIGIRYLKLILRYIFSISFSSTVKGLKYLNQFPFRIHYIVFFSILTLFNKIPWVSNPVKSIKIIKRLKGI